MRLAANVVDGDDTGLVVDGTVEPGTVEPATVEPGTVVTGTVVAVPSHSVWNCHEYGTTASPRASDTGAVTDTSTRYQVQAARFSAGCVSIMRSPELEP